MSSYNKRVRKKIPFLECSSSSSFFLDAAEKKKSHDSSSFSDYHSLNIYICNTYIYSIHKYWVIKKQIFFHDEQSSRQ